MTPRILLLTGMTPNPRIFARLLPALPAAAMVPWIEPLTNETIEGYASRLALSIDDSGPVVVCGVSFGGIVARELAWQLNARGCVLISSVRSPGELPSWLRMLRPLAGRRLDSVLDTVGRIAQAVPTRVRMDASARLTKLAGRAGSWHRWASCAVLRWQPSQSVEQVPTLQINGSRDSTFPLKYVHPDIVIAGGSHTMALTHADEISSAISRFVFNLPHGPTPLSTHPRLPGGSP